MVPRPTATGFVGGSDGKKRVSEKKTPAAKQNAAVQRSAETMRSDNGRAFMRAGVYFGVRRPFSGGGGVFRGAAAMPPLGGRAAMPREGRAAWPPWGTAAAAWPPHSSAQSVDHRIMQRGNGRVLRLHFRREAA